MAKLFYYRLDRVQALPKIKMPSKFIIHAYMQIITLGELAIILREQKG